MDTIRKDRFMNRIRSIRTARPDLFPLNADEIVEVELKARMDPSELTDNDVLLLAVSQLEDLLYQVYTAEDPDHGDDRFYEDLLS